MVKKAANIHARLIDQYKFKYQTVFPSRFDKQDEVGQVLDKIELYINLKINQKITQSKNDIIDVRSQLERQIQNRKSTDSGCSIDKIKSMTV